MRPFFVHRARINFCLCISREQELTGLRRAGVPMGAKAAAEPASARTAVARESIVL